MNLFDAQDWMIAQINANVIGFKTVGNPGLIAGIKEIGSMLPCCIVQPGGGEIADKDRNAVGLVEDQFWQVTVITGYEFDEVNYGMTESTAGQLMDGVINALNGKSPGAGFVKLLMYAGREDPVYSLGYAEFPMTFRVKKVVGNASFL